MKYQKVVVKILICHFLLIFKNFAYASPSPYVSLRLKTSFSLSLTVIILFEPGGYSEDLPASSWRRRLVLEPFKSSATRWPPLPPPLFSHPCFSFPMSCIRPRSRSHSLPPSPLPSPPLHHPCVPENMTRCCLLPSQKDRASRAGYSCSNVCISSRDIHFLVVGKHKFAKLINLQRLCILHYNLMNKMFNSCW